MSEFTTTCDFCNMTIRCRGQTSESAIVDGIRDHLLTSHRGELWELMIADELARRQYETS